MSMWYSSNDIDAPVLTGTLYSMDNLINTCMVTGYGSKAGAGWIRQTEIATGDSLYKTSGTNPTYIRIIDNNTHTNSPKNYYIYCYRNSDMSQCYTPTDYSGRKSSTNDNIPRSWDIFSNGKTTYIFTNPGDNTYNICILVGEYISYANILYPHFISPRSTDDSYNEPYSGRCKTCIGYNESHGRLSIGYENNTSILDTSLQLLMNSMWYSYLFDSYEIGSANIMSFQYTNFCPIERILVTQSTIGILGYLPGIWTVGRRRHFTHKESYIMMIQNIERHVIAYDILQYGQVLIEISDTWNL